MNNIENSYQPSSTRQPRRDPVSIDPDFLTERLEIINGHARSLAAIKPREPLREIFISVVQPITRENDREPFPPPNSVSSPNLSLLISPSTMALFNLSSHDADRVVDERENGEIDDDEDEVCGYQCTNSPRVHQPLDDTIEWACCDRDYLARVNLCNYFLYF
jgi:hypothetical protein